MYGEENEYLKDTNSNIEIVHPLYTAIIKEQMVKSGQLHIRDLIMENARNNPPPKSNKGVGRGNGKKATQ